MSEANFVAEVLADKNQPVVLFALEWCEFCWSVRKFFKRLDIPYRSVDLDSVEYQQDSRGRNVRDVLEARTGMKTIPQIFVGGEHVGGCTDVFDTWKTGDFQRLLDKAGVAYRHDLEIEPYSFLPEWLHPRA